MDLIKKAISLGFKPKDKDYYLWEIQKWLREVHNIEVNLQMWNGACKSYKYVLQYNKEKLNYTTHGNHIENFEQALEVGLLEALKLIKNES